ncbi:MAG: FkbM family methyltransferase [Acidobacteriia bacterium]|nr:FkbM family methyltransferase [Terriglobia bacterium]
MPDTSQFRSAHFSLKDRFASFVSENFFGGLTYTVRHGIIKGMKRKGGLGFLPGFLARSPENEPELTFLRNLDLEGKGVYDIGAFQGVMTLFFARQAKAVISYEPLPANYRRVVENVELNELRHVVVLNRALGNQKGSLRLTVDPRMPGAASGDPGVSAQIAGSVPEAVTTEVPIVTLDEDIEQNGLPPPDFIKIDIEGMELPALEGMRRTLAARHPLLYLEMHGSTETEKVQRAREVIQFLLAIGYASILHVESGTQISATNAPVARSGHIFCKP